MKNPVVESWRESRYVSKPQVRKQTFVTKILYGVVVSIRR